MRGAKPVIVSGSQSVCGAGTRCSKHCGRRNLPQQFIYFIFSHSTDSPNHGPTSSGGPPGQAEAGLKLPCLDRVVLSLQAYSSSMLSPTGIYMDSHANPQYLAVHLRRSKADQFGAGTTLYLCGQERLSAQWPHI